MFLALCLTTVGLIRQLVQQQSAQSQAGLGVDLRRLIPWLVTALVAGFMFIVFQAWLEYRRRDLPPENCTSVK